MKLILKENCKNCRNKDFIPPKDKHGIRVFPSCSECNDTGIIITEDGQTILDFLTECFRVINLK